jgi:hypothetical protein
LALLTPLSVIFIPYRGFFVMYLPLAGWAMFAAALMAGGCNGLWTHVWKRPPLSSNFHIGTGKDRRRPTDRPPNAARHSSA